jgi:hypothetical protein
MWPQKFTPRHEARGNGMNKKPLIERNLYYWTQPKDD